MNPLTELLIRKANMIDAEPISHLLSECQWFTYKDLYSEAYIQRLIQKYYNVERIKQEVSLVDIKWHGYYIAEMGGIIVGAIGGGMIDDTDGEIYVFYVDPTKRGHGIGTRLLDFYTKIQKHTFGAVKQWVSVAKGNIYGIPFYEAKGFSFEREEIAYDSDVEDNDLSVVYSRQIGN